MNSELDNRKLIWGLMLLSLGVLDLLRKVDLLIFSPLDVLALLLFVALGARFSTHFRHDKARWKQLLPTGILFSLAAVVSLDLVRLSAFQAPIFLMGLAATFTAIFILTARRQWWAAIPAGILFTLSLLATSEALPFVQLANRGAIFLLGVTLTFTFLYLVPSASGRQCWAKHPALATAALSSIIWISSIGLVF